MAISIKFETRKDGKNYVCDIGSARLYGLSQADLKTQVEKYIHERLQQPRVALVKVHDQIRILVNHGTAVEHYKPRELDGNDEGSIKLTNYSTGYIDDFRSFENEITSELMNLAQQTWDGIDDTPPAYLNEDAKRDYEAWIRFQRAYAIAKESGCSPAMCHELACNAKY